MIIDNQKYNLESKHYIMGILNLTPDSFSDGGKYNSLDQALYRVETMIKEGADIIDLGGQSSRPGYMEIPFELELERVMPVLEAINNRFFLPISLDTYKSQVVNEAAGLIHMVNDITGLQGDESMARVIKTNNLSCCIMAHKDHKNKEWEQSTYGDNFISEVIEELKLGLSIAETAGISKDKIMIDGGVGFGKNHKENLITINRTKDIVSLGYPVLMATSNKGFMREITGNLDLNRRDETVSTTIMGAMMGARFFRVHDVAANKKALQMFESIQNETMPQ